MATFAEWKEWLLRAVEEVNDVTTTTSAGGYALLVAVEIGC